MPPAIDAERVVHHYGQRRALDDVTFQIAPAEVFVFLGPNGGGKTTLFRLLSTLLPPQQGRIALFGHDVVRDTTAVRRRIGVVFQAPSLDRKLTVAENLRHQGRLYGLSRREIAARAADLLARFALADRATDRVESLSGGLRRRVEIAKALLHSPSLLLLDEPSTGLDPGVRLELWDHLQSIRRQDGVTVVMTTHLLDEAEKADRIALIDQGRLVALASPDELRATVGGDSILIESHQPRELAAAIGDRFQLTATLLDGQVRLEQPQGHRLIAQLVEAFPGRIRAITVGKPTLQDVFIDRCGRRL
jgi:ABC-2 type transport system ATP-binding protein